MNLAEKSPPRKEATRLRPNELEGLYIHFCLRKRKYSYVSIGKSLGLSWQAVAFVTRGKRRSARIESEIARILGKADWNAVVLEARSEIQKKPVKVILEEMRQAREGRLKAARKRMSEYIAHNTPGKAGRVKV